MSMLLGWIGVLLIGSSMMWGAARASMLKSAIQVTGLLLLGVYAAMRADHPVMVLALVVLTSVLIGHWRGRQDHRRARQVDVTLACDRFERARRAVKESVTTPLPVVRSEPSWIFHRGRSRIFSHHRRVPACQARLSVFARGASKTWRSSSASTLNASKGRTR